MKKIKIVFAVTTLLLCLCLATSAHAEEMETTLVKIKNNVELEDPTADVLQKGYYIFACSEGGMDEKNFIGDLKVSYATFENFNANYFKQVLGLEIAESEFYENLIIPFTANYKEPHIKETGVYFIRVYSYGAFYTTEYIEHIIGYGLALTSPNLDSTTAGNKTHVVSVDFPISLEQLKQRYKATDNVDGVLTNKLSFKTNYDPENLRLGSYYVYTSVKDDAQHQTHAMDIVLVKDFIAPELFLSETDHEVKVGEVFTSNDARKFFSATDNFLSSKEIKIFLRDTYQSQYNKVGEYEISGYAYDTEDNRSEILSLKIKVIDDVAPTISLAAGGNIIKANYELNEQEIKQLLKVTDNYYDISAEDVEIVSNTCTGEQGVEYQIVTRVTDESGNIGESTFQYYILDTVYPIIIVEDALYLPLDVYYNNAQILEMLKEAGLIDPDATNVEIISTFDCTNLQEGVYSISYIETFADGSQKIESTDLTFFNPIKKDMEENTNPSTHPAYYALFFLPAFFTILYFIIRRNHYEKN